ncbi:MAG: hypothetical protein ACK40U_01235 [Fervidobacterium pennivorans]
MKRRKRPAIKINPRNKQEKGFWPSSANSSKPNAIQNGYQDNSQVVQNPNKLSTNGHKKEVEMMFGNGGEKKQKRIIFTAGSKGGVGKTLFAKTIYFWLKIKGANVLGIDADSENREFFMCHSRKEEVAEALGLESIEIKQIDMKRMNVAKSFFNLLTESPSDIFLIDMPGASTREMLEIFQNFDLTNVAAVLGYKVTLVPILNTTPTMKVMMSELTKAFGDTVNYVVVKNHHFCDLGQEDFNLWDACTTRDALLKEGGLEIALPKLTGGVTQTMANMNLSFFEINDLSFGDFLLARSFLEKAMLELEKADNVLGFDLCPLSTRHRRVPFNMKQQVEFAV